MQSLDAGRHKKSHYLPTNGVGRCPARRPNSRARMLVRGGAPFFDIAGNGR